ncbi:MAG: type II secretion system F family protein [Candidatus Woesearchaeota archaeon]
MNIKKKYGVIFNFLQILGVSLFFVSFIFLKNSKFFMTYVILSLIIFIFPNWLLYYLESIRQQKLEQYFPDFIRDLSSAIKSGKPLPLALGEIINNEYGALTYYVRKLYYQINWGVPAVKAFQFFSILTDDPLIERAMSIVVEAVRSGGELDVVLDAVHQSLIRIKLLEEQRKSMVMKQTVQNYIIFFIFLGIIIVLQNFLLPVIEQLADSGTLNLLLGATGGGVKLERKVVLDSSSLGAFFLSFSRWFVSIHGVFMSLILLQGLFTGLFIGKLSTGKAATGTKHSFILMSTGALILSIASSLG